MGLTAQLKEWYIKTMPGMNNLVEDLDLKDKWVEIAQNCRFETEPGAVDKRSAVTYFNSTTMGSGAYGVTGLKRFYTSGGLTVFICVHDTSAYVGNDTAGTWTEIRTGLTVGKRATFVTYKDLIMVGNGYDNIWVFDGESDNVTWELGSCKAVLSSTAGGNLDASADYSYQVGITVSGTEHICGAVSNTVATDATYQRIDLSNIPLGPSGTTNRKIYRTEGDGSAYYLIATISDNTTTTYADNIADTTATPIGSVTDDMPVGAELQMHRERLFISRDPSNPNKIYYSNVYLPHFIQQTTNLDYMEINPEDGDEISGIPIQMGTMVCIKKNTIRKLHVTSAASGADPITWYAEDPIAWNGTPAPWSVTHTPYGIAFLGWDHWYMFDGSGALTIIDEFDVKDILEGDYSDVVGFYHKGVLLAAYTDKETANQYHDRIMRYNFKRKALGYDIWTSDTLSGPNCFASKSGDDETGELYYGDSQKGYVVKDKEAENVYKLRTKNECNDGTKSTVYVGGTEAVPYMEIGSSTSAATIPDDICIFWDQATTTPGAGWTEVTGFEDKIIKISATYGTTSSGTSHSHTVLGNLNTSSAGKSNAGDGGSGAAYNEHAHAVSLTSGTATPLPRYIKYRIFKANSCTTTEFPDGAIIMWDQSSPPTGWQTVSIDAYIMQDTSGLGTLNQSAHSHTFSDFSNNTTCTNAVCDPNGYHPTLGTNPHYIHKHSMSGTLYSSKTNSWDLDCVKLHFIKKIGESDTWDGVDKYCYALYASTGTPTGWTEVSSTYEGKFLRSSGGAAISTSSAGNAAHTHTVSSGTSGDQNYTNGTGGYHAIALAKHNHSWTTLTTSSSNASAPPSVTFRMHKFILGKMRAYNAALLSKETAGTWTSPAMEIKAESLLKMFWNERNQAPTTDNILFYVRTGATAAACTSSTAWSTAMTDPNGSIIDADADVWLQYKIEFTADDTTNDNPRVYFADGYVCKYTYLIGAVEAETSVNWKYSIGFRNFNAPMEDKIFKKITTVHEGETGSFDLEWKTENTDATDTFTIDLTSNPRHWNSFFPSSAFGKEINFTFYKNDLYDYRLKEIRGFYSPYPVLL